MHKHPAYTGSWRAMHNRCNNPNYPEFHLYGGRGITVCERWNDFANFWEDMGPTWKPGLTIDRIDSNGNYEPNNGKWSTDEEQANNRRNNRIIPTPQGPMNVTQAAKIFGISRITIYARILYGWDENDLLLPVGLEHDNAGRFCPKSGRMAA